MLVEHHIKYKEIHGVDETIWMEKGEHLNLHRRLRNEGKCKIPPKELKKIATAAYARTKKAKEANARYNKNDFVIAYNIKYNKENQRVLVFDETMMLNVLLREFWVYNKKIGTINISSHFVAQHGKKLYYIDKIIERWQQK